MKYVFMVLKNKSTIFPEPMFYTFYSDSAAMKKAKELRKLFAHVSVYKKVARKYKNRNTRK